ncbi:hypothetical protein [uncultured Paraglaciecola sp.]|uniref:hypothetical protein n=1 Tax=uncultured Paraglaciecola sp. TaxID=1765024 RepID=UPI00260DE570|nr:hypothetical protein [uncultured Paraglaciecola sp.]
MKNTTNLVTVSELKQSPSRVMDEANRTGEPVGIIRNNRLEGYYVPNGAIELEIADPVAVRQAVDDIVDQHGDALSWLAKN